MSAGALPVEPVAPVPAGVPALEVRGITKRFGALSVLRGIDFSLHQGEVLGLVGDNGAGKSTLVKILSGFHQPDGGEILIEGQQVTFSSVASARGN
jgi:ABC-type sugar transport system ATPase subunit